MSDLVRRSLDRIERSLERLRRVTLLAALRPGLRAEETRERLASLALDSSPQLEALYAWRDGTGGDSHTLGELALFPGFYLLSLDDATANYRAFVGDRRWRPEWLPVFADGGGDFYVVDLSTDFRGIVRHFRIDETEHPVEFLSIEYLLTTIAEAFEKSAFVVNDEQYMDIDDAKFIPLAAALNPDVSWWQTWPDL